MLLRTATLYDDINAENAFDDEIVANSANKFNQGFDISHLWQWYVPLGDDIQHDKNQAG